MTSSISSIDDHGVLGFVIGIFTGLAVLVLLILFVPRTDSGKSAIEGKVVVAEGVFERVEYTAAPSTAFYGASTIIYFVEGNNYVIKNDHISVSFTKNTHIRIVKESDGNYVIQRVD